MGHAAARAGYRVLHIGLGPLGQMICRSLEDRGVGVVAAAVDVAPGVAGRTLADVLDRPGAGGVTIAPTLAAAAGVEVDCAVVTTASDLRACMGTFRELLGRGVSVVSTCEELVFPWLRHAELAAELDELARRNGCGIMGTGVNPGFVMDALPVFTTAVSASVESVRCERIQDAGSRRVPFQKKIGAGLSEEEFAAGIKAGWLRHVGLGESMHFIAKYVGLGIERWEEEIGPVIAEREMECALGTIRKGHAAGVRQTASAWDREGREVVRMEFQAAIGQEEPRDRVVIEGIPAIDLVIRGGVHGDVATTAITINAIGSLLGAGPGLHTMATVPVVRFRH